MTKTTEPTTDALYLARKLRRDMPNNRAVEIVTRELERLAAIVASVDTSTPKPAHVDTSTETVSTPVDVDDRRKAYQRDWAKKKRAAVKEPQK